MRELKFKKSKYTTTRSGTKPLQYGLLAEKWGDCKFP